VADHRAAVSITDLGQLLELLPIQLGVALSQVIGRVLEPFGSMLIVRFQHSAPLNMTEQFIASAVEDRRLVLSLSH
jgi:hypothetical protein